MAYSVKFADKNVQEDGIDGLPMRIMDSAGVNALAVDSQGRLTFNVNMPSTDTVNAIGVVTTAATLVANALNTLTLTHGQTCVLTMPTAVAGQSCKLLATQDTTTAFDGLITHTGVKVAGNSLPIMSKGTGVIDYYMYYCADGTNWELLNVQQRIGSASVNAIGTVTTAATLKLGLNTLTLTNAQACTLTMPTAVASAECKLVAHQSAVSTFNGTIVHTSVKYAGGSIPAQTASSGAIDMYEYISDGTIWILKNVQQAIA